MLFGHKPQVLPRHRGSRLLRTIGPESSASHLGGQWPMNIANKRPSKKTKKKGDQEELCEAVLELMCAFGRLLTLWMRHAHAWLFRSRAWLLQFQHLSAGSSGCTSSLTVSGTGSPFSSTASFVDPNPQPIQYTHSRTKDHPFAISRHAKMAVVRTTRKEPCSANGCFSIPLSMLGSGPQLGPSSATFALGRTGGVKTAYCFVEW